MAGAVATGAQEHLAHLLFLNKLLAHQLMGAQVVLQGPEEEVVEDLEVAVVALEVVVEAEGRLVIVVKQALLEIRGLALPQQHLIAFQLSPAVLIQSWWAHLVAPLLFHGILNNEPKRISQKTPRAYSSSRA